MSKRQSMQRNSEEVAAILKVLSHPQRLSILCHLGEGSKTVTELQALCEISQSHVSQFLNKMKLQGIVKSTKEGNFVYYTIANDKVIELLGNLHSIFCYS